MGRWAALVVGLVLVGGALTYLFAPPVAGHEHVTQLKDDPGNGTDNAGGRAPMPGVTGLSLETLRVVLRDAGASDVEVVTKTAPAPGPAGRIIAQDPAAGQPIGSKVTVTTSTPMAMPAVVGKDFTAVRADLQRQGAVVRATPVIRPGAKIGTVLGSVPAAGSTIPTVVTLSVADPGQALALTDLGSRDYSDCSDSSSLAFGTTTVDVSGLACTVTSTGSFIEFALDQQALSLAFTLGYDANGGRGTASVRVLGDGRALANLSVTDKPTPRRVDVSGVTVLRLEVRGTVISADNPPVVAFGDALVQGRPAQIDALAKQ